MASLSTWVRYAANKFGYSVSLSWKNYNVGQINAKEFSDAIWKNFFQGKLTFLHWTKGEEMAPAITTGGNLLVRKMAFPVPTFLEETITLIENKWGSLEFGKISKSDCSRFRDAPVYALSYRAEVTKWISQCCQPRTHQRPTSATYAYVSKLGFHLDQLLIRPFSPWVAGRLFGPHLLPVDFWSNKIQSL